MLSNSIILWTSCIIFTLQHQPYLTTVWAQWLWAEPQCQNYVFLLTGCGPGMSPGCLLFLWLQWKTCGIQLLGLCGGKWGSCWRPPWPQGGEDAFWHSVELQSTRTYCSLHHNRAVNSLLHCTCNFSTLLFFIAPKPQRDLQFCG